MHTMVDKLGMDENEPIESKMVTKAVESAQKRVEGNNYDMRKNLLEYDDVIRRQREVIYGQRQDILETEDLTDIIFGMVESSVTRLVHTFAPADSTAFVTILLSIGSFSSIPNLSTIVCIRSEPKRRINSSWNDK